MYLDIYIRHSIFKEKRHRNWKVSNKITTNRRESTADFGEISQTTQTVNQREQKQKNCNIGFVECYQNLIKSFGWLNSKRGD